MGVTVRPRGFMVRSFATATAGSQLSPASISVNGSVAVLSDISATQPIVGQGMNVYAHVASSSAGVTANSYPGGATQSSVSNAGNGPFYYGGAVTADIGGQAIVVRVLAQAKVAYLPLTGYDSILMPMVGVLPSTFQGVDLAGKRLTVWVGEQVWFAPLTVGENLLNVVHNNCLKWFTAAVLASPGATLTQPSSGGSTLGGTTTNPTTPPVTTSSGSSGSTTTASGTPSGTTSGTSKTGITAPKATLKVASGPNGTTGKQAVCHLSLRNDGTVSGKWTLDGDITYNGTKIGTWIAVTKAVAAGQTVTVPMASNGAISAKWGGKKLGATFHAKNLAGEATATATWTEQGSSVITPPTNPPSKPSWQKYLPYAIGAAGAAGVVAVAVAVHDHGRRQERVGYAALARMPAPPPPPPHPAVAPRVA